MKSFRIIPIIILLVAATTISFAQSKEESFKVSGNCGMCKSKIEKAAKSAGATYALWDSESKTLIVKYDGALSNSAKIQQKIADVGYDNAGFKATDKAYNKLHSCCKYEREANVNESCCVSGKCDKPVCIEAGCCKDGKCDMSLCKEKGCCAPGNEAYCCKQDDAKASCCTKGKDATGKKEKCSGSCCAKN